MKQRLYAAIAAQLAQGRPAARSRASEASNCGEDARADARAEDK